MNRMKLIIAIIIGAITLASCSSNSKEKKEIKIAYANWAEGIAITNLTKVILQEQGYDVELMNADVAPIFASISRKKADIFMDVWMPVTHKDYIEKYNDKLEFLDTLYNNARIGLVVPEYVTINSIDEMNSVKDKFESEIVGIDAGAGIMKTTEVAIPEYALEYKLMTSSGPAMTASLGKAIGEQKWIVVTGWTPHWMFDRYKLKMLDDSKNVYGKSEIIQSIAWKGFSEKDPFVAELIRNMKFTDEEISSLMTAMEKTQSNEEDAARLWIEKNKALVDSWIPKK